MTQIRTFDFKKHKQQGAMSDDKDYILGTHADELHRLGIQHQVWAKDAQIGWAKAGFKRGDVLLDLGSGPGFCSKELAFIAGTEGKVIAVDKSEHYINFIHAINKQYRLNIEPIQASFNALELDDSSIDGVFIRWALAWISNVDDICAKLHQAMKPGGRMVIHEYINWMTHKTEPAYPNLNKAIKAAFDSFQDSEGDINIGLRLPQLLGNLNFKVVSVRPITVMARPSDFAWQWPRSFYDVYFPALGEMGYLSANEVELALSEVTQLEAQPNSIFYGPSVVEIIAEK